MTIKCSIGNRRPGQALSIYSSIFTTGSTLAASTHNHILRCPTRHLQATQPGPAHEETLHFARSLHTRIASVKPKARPHANHRPTGAR